MATMNLIRSEHFFRPATQAVHGAFSAKIFFLGKLGGLKNLGKKYVTLYTKQFWINFKDHSAVQEKKLRQKLAHALPD